jgi:hypothetical protein
MSTHSIPVEAAISVVGVERSSLPIRAGKKRFGLALYRPPIKSVADERGNEDLVVVQELSGLGSVRVNVPGNSGDI